MHSDLHTSSPHHNSALQVSPSRVAHPITAHNNSQNQQYRPAAPADCICATRRIGGPLQPDEPGARLVVTPVAHRARRACTYLKSGSECGVRSLRPNRRRRRMPFAFDTRSWYFSVAQVPYGLSARLSVRCGVRCLLCSLSYPSHVARLPHGMSIWFRACPLMRTSPRSHVQLTFDISMSRQYLMTLFLASRRNACR